MRIFLDNIGLIYFLLVGTTLTEVTNLFLLNNFKRNDNTILKYFMTNVKKQVLMKLLKALKLLITV